MPEARRGLRIAAIWLTAVTVVGAEDPWTKVRELKSGTELRIFRKGAKLPVLASMDELKEDSLVVVGKNEQTGIPKDEIDRIDYRPSQSGGRLKRETKTIVEAPSTRATRPQDSATPSGSSSTSVTIGSKPDFETIYRRGPAVPNK